MLLANAPTPTNSEFCEIRKETFTPYFRQSSGTISGSLITNLRTLTDWKEVHFTLPVGFGRGGGGVWFTARHTRWRNYQKRNETKKKKKKKRNRYALFYKGTLVSS